MGMTHLFATHPEYIRYLEACAVIVTALFVIYAWMRVSDVEIRVSKLIKEDEEEL